MKRTKIYGSLIVTILLVVGVISQVQAQGMEGMAYSTEATLYTMPGDSMIVDSWSKLVRTDDALSMILKTSGLVPDSPYTVWWVIFNNPGACSAAPDGDPTVPVCDLDDVFNADGVLDPRPLPRISFVWATGNMSDASGSATFSAYIEEGEAPGFAAFGPALQDARGAAVHLVVRAHGPTDLATLFEQMNTAEADGVNVQAAIHDPF